MREVACVRDRMVTLKGLVRGEEERRMAVQDAWTVLGVYGVEERLQVQALGAR